MRRSAPRPIAAARSAVLPAVTFRVESSSRADRQFDMSAHGFAEFAYSTVETGITGLASERPRSGAKTRIDSDPVGMADYGVLASGFPERDTPLFLSGATGCASASVR